MAKGKAKAPKQQRGSRATGASGQSLGTETLVIAAALLLLPLAVNYELLADQGVEWVSYDDDTNFEQNTHVMRMTSENINWAINDGVVLGVYEPASLIIKMLLADMLGFSRYVYILASLVLHGLNSLMAFVASVMFLNILQRQAGAEADGQSIACAGLAAALIGVHPQRTEVLAWPSCFPYILAGFFSLLSTLCFLTYHTRNADWTPTSSRLLNPWMLSSMAFYSIAVFCKASTITLLVLFIAVDMCILFGSGKASAQTPIARILSVLSIVANYGLMGTITVFALYAATTADFGTKHVMAQPIQLNPGGRVTRACFMLLVYLVNVVIPSAISVRCLVPEDDMFSTMFLASCAVVVPLSLGCVYGVLCGKDPKVIMYSLSWLVYIGILSPCLGLVAQHVQMLAADRYTYVCMLLMGPSVLAPIFRLLMDKVEQGNKGMGKLLWPAASASGLALVAYYSTLSAHTWATNAGLWTEVLKVNGMAGAVRYKEHAKDVDAMVNLGEAYKVSDPDKMESIFTDVLSLKPDNYHALIGIGYLLFGQDRFAEALPVYEKVISVAPNTQVEAYGSSGVMYQNLGRFKEAELRYKTAISMKPDYFNARYNYGNMLRTLDGRANEAIVLYKGIINASPKNLAFMDTYNNLAATELQQMKDPQSALNTWRKALKLVPHRHDMWSNVAVVNNQIGHMDEAVYAQTRALKIVPHDAKYKEVLELLKRKAGK